MTTSRTAKIEIPTWAIPVLMSVLVGIGGYVVGQMRSYDEMNIRLNQAEHRLDRIESSVEQITVTINNQAVRFAEVAIELKTLNKNLEGK